MVSESSSASFLYVTSVGVYVFACVCDIDVRGVGVNVCSVGTCIACFSVVGQYQEHLLPPATAGTHYKQYTGSSYFQPGKRL